MYLLFGYQVHGVAFGVPLQPPKQINKWVPQKGTPSLVATGILRGALLQLLGAT